MMDSGRSLADSLAHLRGKVQVGEAPASPGGPGQPKSVVDLQNLLIDERMRCETHRTNYQTLKEEHKKLQDEHIKVQNELSKMHNNGIESTEQLQALNSDLQNQLVHRNRELEEVRMQVLHPNKLEIIKAEIAKELEEPLKAHMVTMDKEVEKYRSEYNKVRYEHTFLKAEYEQAKAEHKRNLEELGLRHQAQVASLQHERDNLLKMQKSTPDVDAQKILNLQRQKNQLEQRVKNLLDEMKEVGKQKEHLASEADLIQRSQAKDLSRLHESIKQIESEKRSTEMQCERLGKELRDKSEQNLRLNQQIQDLSKEAASLKNIADEESHRHKVALTNQKLEFLQSRGELERENESLSNRMQGLEAELDVAKISINNHQREIEEMERDFSRRLQETREAEWSKNNQMQNDKVQMEEKCRELEQRLQADRESRDAEREEIEERQKHFDATESAMKSEMSKLQIRLEHEKESRQQLERDREECALLRQKLSDCEKQLQAVTSSKQQVLSEAERSRDALRVARAEVENAREQAGRAQLEAERSQENDKLVWMEEKHRMQSKLDQLEHKVRRSREESERSSKQQRKIKHALIDKVRGLRSKVELLEAEKEQFEIQLKTGRHGVSMEEYNKMRRRMREHRQRHNEFRRAIGLSETLPLLSSTVNQDMTSFGANVTNLSVLAERDEYREEIKQLRRRLDEFIRTATDKENCDVTDEKADDNYENDEFASTTSSS
uniref:Centrosomal protein of 83 kDa n=1 Tax=Phallusia mammillata TaxID=59560 RepID=A0A6F9D992_9ASCI|nr:centrosomal protein of 83 kDa [Phallusia mammillata]